MALHRARRHQNTSAVTIGTTRPLVVVHAAATQLMAATMTQPRRIRAPSVAASALTMAAVAKNWTSGNTDAAMNTNDCSWNEKNRMTADPPAA